MSELRIGDDLPTVLYAGNVEITAIYAGDILIYPPAVYYTTLLYPQVQVEKIKAISGVLTNARTVVQPSPTDPLKAQGFISGAVLTVTTTYQSITQKPDELKAQGFISGAVLTVTTTYQSITQKPDELKASGAVIGAVLTVTTTYVSITQEPEKLKASGALTGAVLT